MNNLISILMPVYNCSSYVSIAINSIINQTYRNWELIIIDDCSTDNTLEIITRFDDSRIKFLQNTVNIGLAASLNKCISVSRGDYIARMDGDDVMMPNRLEYQIDFLINNVDVDVVGGAAYLIDEFGNKIGSKKNYNPKTYKQLLLNQGFFIHPTIMGRASWFRSNLYNADILRGQDLELWIRTFNYSKFVNIDEFLIYYREIGVDYKLKYKQIYYALKIILKIHENSIPYFLRKFILYRAFIKFYFFNVFFFLRLLMPEHKRSLRSNNKFIN